MSQTLTRGKEPDQAVADRVDQGREETMKNEDQLYAEGENP
jgi:hypothetical protein